MSPGPRIAIAHDYLTQEGGAERVVLALSKAFPGAPVYTMLYEPERTYPEFRDLEIVTSPVNRVSLLRHHHRTLAPMWPLVASRVDIPADVVICSSSGWSHGFRTTGTKIVYCHTPARWIYQTDHFFGRRGNELGRRVATAVRPLLRRWDQRAARTVDTYLANSTVVRERIQLSYGREAAVVPAPALAFLGAITRPDEVDGGYFLVVARLLPYKNVDVVVRAFAGRNARLIVVGHGPEEARLRAMATPNVEFRSRLTDAELLDLYRHARAVLAASFEDFGLTPIEAGVLGRPAITLRAGGFLDTVLDGVSGLYFDEPEPEHVARALDRFEEMSWDRDKIRAWVGQFSEEKFISKIREIVAGHLEPPGARSDHDVAQSPTSVPGTSRWRSEQ